MGNKRRYVWVLSGALILSGCQESEEAARVDLGLEVLPSLTTPILTDSGFEVTVSEASVVLKDLEFTIRGEEHGSLWDLIVPSALAHPGHYSGGQVTGELPGTFEVDLLVGRELGTASLIVGTYEGANLSFGSLPGSTSSVRIVGEATRNEDVVDFVLDVDIDPSFQTIGIPFETEISEGEKRTITLEVLSNDGMAGLFDGVDFESRVGVAGPATLAEGDANRVRRRFLAHTFYSLEAR